MVVKKNRTPVLLRHCFLHLVLAILLMGQATAAVIPDSPGCACCRNGVLSISEPHIQMARCCTGVQTPPCCQMKPLKPSAAAAMATAARTDTYKPVMNKALFHPAIPQPVNTPANVPFTGDVFANRDPVPIFLNTLSIRC